MVSEALILETILKWLIPTLCVAIVGLITAKIIKPLKKQNKAERQQQFDECLQSSTVAASFCDQHYQQLKSESDKNDKEILSRIDNLTNCIEESQVHAEDYHKKVDKHMDLIQKGVLDAHLQNLIATCEVYIKRGYITPVELQAYQERYTLYKNLGGNGHMEPWNRAIMNLPHSPLPTSKNTVVPSVKPPTTHL